MRGSWIWAGSFFASLGAVPVAFGVASAKDAAPAALPSPEVRLAIETRAAGELWRMEVTNVGNVPLRLVADARLLRLELHPVPSEISTPVEKGKKTAKKEPTIVVCELPATMRSNTRVATLPPGGRYIEAFDPRLYCLEASSHLVSGTTVTAHLGWQSKPKEKLAAPFVVFPLAPLATAAFSADAPTLASAKEIVAPPKVLELRATGKPVASTSTSASTSASTGSPALPPSPVKTEKSGLAIKSGSAQSLAYGKGVHATISIQNNGPEPRSIYARPQLVSARVRGPRGDVFACTGPNITPAPIVDFITRLPVSGTWSGSVLIEGLCPEGAFDLPGLYEVTPILRAPPIPSVPKAIHGQLAPQKPQLVRVEVGNKSFHDAPPFVIKPAAM